MNWMAHYGDPCRASRTLPDVQCEVTVTFSNRLVYNLKLEQFKSVRFYHVALNAYRSTVLHENITGILWRNSVENRTVCPNMNNFSYFLMYSLRKSQRNGQIRVIWNSTVSCGPTKWTCSQNTILHKIV